MSATTILTWVILIWFTTAILAEVIGLFAFAVWLRRHEVDLVFGLVGVPGYLEYRYVHWRTSRGESPRRVVVLRLFLLLNMVLSMLCAFPIFSSGAK